MFGQNIWGNLNAISVDAKFIDVTVCRNALQGQLYLLLHTNGNYSHMYLLGSLTMLWNRFGQSDHHSVWFSVSYAFLRSIAKRTDVSGWNIWRHSEFLQRTSLNHFQQTLAIPAALIASLFCQISSEDKSLSNDGMWFIISAVVQTKWMILPLTFELSKTWPNL